MKPLVYLAGQLETACLGVAVRLALWRERRAPETIEPLDAARAERIRVGVMTRIQAAPLAEPSPFAEPFTVPAGTAIVKFQGFH